MLDQFWYDSKGGGASSTFVMRNSKTYLITVDGNYTNWGGNLAGSPPLVKYPSPGVPVREAARDADVKFGDPNVIMDPTEHATTFQFSIGASTLWVHLEPIGGPFTVSQPDFIYSYLIKGKGHELTVRVPDSPRHDNNGMFLITIVEEILTDVPPLRQKQRDYMRQGRAKRSQQLSVRQGWGNAYL